VAALVGVDERGQMVLPKEVRDRAGIGPGDRLAVVTMEGGDESCCIVLVKADRLTEMVRGMLGPLVEGLVGKV
jgi:AbrB family looped-hinge helix DNA binding protein